MINDRDNCKQEESSVKKDLQTHHHYQNKILSWIHLCPLFDMHIDQIEQHPHLFCDKNLYYVKNFITIQIQTVSSYVQGLTTVVLKNSALRRTWIKLKTLVIWCCCCSDQVTFSEESEKQLLVCCPVLVILRKFCFFFPA